MIDLHSHILPGLDDGASNIMESVAMAKIAVDCGIRGMAVTPHCSNDRRNDIRTGLMLLRDVLQEANIPLILYPGMEIKGSTNTADMLSNGQLITINGSRYPLIEFDFKSTGEMETNILNDVILAGFTPIVAHPERYTYVQKEPELLNLWKQMGCGFQINRGSFLGHFGEAAGSGCFRVSLVDFGEGLLEGGGIKAVGDDGGIADNVGSHFHLLHATAVHLCFDSVTDGVGFCLYFFDQGFQFLEFCDLCCDFDGRHIILPSFYLDFAVLSGCQPHNCVCCSTYSGRCCNWLCVVCD